MAFDATTKAKIESVRSASRMIQILASVYLQAKSAQALVQLYVGNTDPVFRAVVDQMFTAGEKAELQAMLTDLNSLVTAWEAQHPGVISSG